MMMKVMGCAPGAPPADCSPEQDAEFDGEASVPQGTTAADRRIGLPRKIWPSARHRPDDLHVQDSVDVSRAEAVASILHGQS
jgi:hypothetical protein